MCFTYTAGCYVLFSETQQYLYATFVQNLTVSVYDIMNRNSLLKWDKAVQKIATVNCVMESSGERCEMHFHKIQQLKPDMSLDAQLLRLAELLHWGDMESHISISFLLCFLVLPTHHGLITKSVHMHRVVYGRFVSASRPLTESQREMW